MRTKLISGPSARRLVASWTALAIGLGPWASLPAQAAAPTSAPQVLLAITNSESMDGTTSGAIMVGSGKLSAAGDSSLMNSASPVNYTIPAGFAPPLNAGTGTQAPYTVTCGGYLCDNGPSRLNLAKGAIKQVLNTYGDALNFGLYTYQTGSPTLYTTWVYQMSPSGGFSFTNTFVNDATTPPNPCYQYASASATVKSNCTSIAAQLYDSSLSTGRYMTLSLSSDDPTVNDVLYAPDAYASVFVDYGSISPTTPFPPNFSLNNYNNGGVRITYGSYSPSNAVYQTGPTNAGYVPYSAQVMYAKRGFGYASSQSATTGTSAVPMTGSISSFNNALAPETNNASSSEVKAVAGQSAIGGLLKGALSYLNGLTKVSCQKQYVVLLTDGLPTLDLNNKAWPPLGSLSGNSYGVTASFNNDGSLASTNNQALTDTINSIKSLSTAGIKTYVIGLGAGVNSASNPMAAQTLKAMAIAGGTTDFYPATEPAALNNAFLSIVQLIYQASSVAAPVAPLTVQSGSSLLYNLSSKPDVGQQAGYVNAFGVAADGTPNSSSSWEVGALMTVGSRTAALKTTATNNSVVNLADVDAAAFNLSNPTTCVPDKATIINYTINPSYTANSCTYIGSRLPGAFLGTFSTQTTGKYVGPPSSSSLIGAAGYSAFARGTQSRPGMLMFTNNDGFLYAVNAKTGALMWGWTPRSVLAQMQYYSTFAATTQLDGNFTVIDTPDASGNWATFVVGSMRSGGKHFSLKLDSSGMPATVVYDLDVSSGSSPGDKAATTGTAPLRQMPQIAYVRGSAYAIYVVNVGSTSRLYEVNVATGAVTSGNLSATVSSALYVNSQNNQVWLGSTAGEIWSTTLTGNGTTDALLALKATSTINPANNSSLLSPILYVGYSESKGIPYLYAANASTLTLFGIAQNGWTPIWASTPATGYTYGSSGFVSSAAVPALTSGGIVSDVPRIDGDLLTVPMFAPPVDSCGTGSGYYDFFDLGSGKFPSTSIRFAGSAILSRVYVGSGPAFTPSVTVTTDGLAFYKKSKNDQGPPSAPINKAIKTGALPIAWRHR